MGHNKLFTLETLAKFYTDAAKAGGIETVGYKGSLMVRNGPNLSHCVSDWRPKQVPVVRYMVKYTNTVTTVRSPESYDDSVMERSWVSYRDAKAWLTEHPSYAGSIIRLVEEQS